MEYVAAILFVLKILLCTVPPVVPAPTPLSYQEVENSLPSSGKIALTYDVGEGL